MRKAAYMNVPGERDDANVNPEGDAFPIEPSITGPSAGGLVRRGRRLVGSSVG